jgi:hypothetical protein
MRTGTSKRKAPEEVPGRSSYGETPPGGVILHNSQPQPESKHNFVGNCISAVPRKKAAPRRGSPGPRYWGLSPLSEVHPRTSASISPDCNLSGNSPCLSKRKAPASAEAGMRVEEVGHYFPSRRGVSVPDSLTKTLPLNGKGDANHRGAVT